MFNDILFVSEQRDGTGLVKSVTSDAESCKETKSSTTTGPYGDKSDKGEKIECSAAQGGTVVGDGGTKEIPVYASLIHLGREREKVLMLHASHRA